jgi:2-polyprenyl-3-methyl-5-hydroxy-6-metoxy-1,4-benzoquinol methylase
MTLLVLAGKSIRPLGYVLSLFDRPLRQTPETWARQYSGGHWDYLETLLELGRYSAIAGYVIKLKSQGAVLDVGCGEGILQRTLRPHYARYLGIDIAADAIRRAAQREDAATTFRVACALEFEPGEQFDAIIFNTSKIRLPCSANTRRA